MKFILFSLIFVLNSFLHAEGFLKASEAFGLSFMKDEKHLLINVKLHEDVYLYVDKVKLSLIEPVRKDLDFTPLDTLESLYKNHVVYLNNLSIKIPIKELETLANSDKWKIRFSYQGCSKNGLCYPPLNKEYSSNDLQNASNPISEQDAIAKSFQNDSIFWVLLSFFGFGILLSLTPCIFPMVPILSSIIVSNSKDKKLSTKESFMLSFVYVFFMSLAYMIAGILAGLFGASLQASLQNPYVIGVFALIFVALAFSMFGFYNLELPSSWQNFASNKSNSFKGKGYLSVAVMGFLSALIVGPCVAAPLAGALIYISQSANWLLGGAALFTLSFGMGVPLLIIGLSAGKLLPRPGIWMDRVKNAFGAVMIGMAIYMLSRVLPDEIVKFLWASFAIFVAVYLNALENLKEANAFAKFLKALGVIALIYGAIGFYNLFGVHENTNNIPSFSDKNNLKQDELIITNMQDLDYLLANTSGPVMLDFWAKWCVACKEMDEKVLSNTQIKNILKNFTIIKVDLTDTNEKTKALLERFGLFGPPAFVFFKDKKELKKLQVVGYMQKDKFKKVLLEVLK